jgi:hypothetical protein
VSAPERNLRATTSRRGAGVGVPQNYFDEDVAAVYDQGVDDIAAAHLEPGGQFLIEVGVPDLRRLPPGEDARVFAHAPGYVGYDR